MRNRRHPVTLAQSPSANMWAGEKCQMAIEKKDKSTGEVKVELFPARVVGKLNSYTNRGQQIEYAEVVGPQTHTYSWEKVEEVMLGSGIFA